ncbi:MerR family transcriptional regulator [Muricoccus radiodurans]|uniref:MerR family transcriptional regulator n=1 Tax=Muricoccus radiodurans TaxID=2231721 RepID=UPI003CF88C9A
MSGHVLGIGEVARLSRLKVPTIRFYESIGLLTTPQRTPANRRSYTGADVGRLRFIRNARDLGFGLPAIRQLLRLAALPEEPCDEADAIAREHLGEIERKVARLLALSAELKAMLDRGAHGRIAQCRVIEILSAEEGDPASP